MGTPPGASAGGRDTYRHGDLSRALVDAGLELARAGGPTAVALRAATRRAGVSPNAAYRHFADRDELLEAVCSASQARVALAIEAEQALVPAATNAVAWARLRFRAVGTGYLHFALAEPGLFQTAFTASTDLESATSAERAGATGRTPFELLTEALDRLVDVGGLSAERRPGAEFLAWSAVHGLAMLLINGPLKALGQGQAEALIQRVVDLVEQGL